MSILAHSASTDRVCSSLTVALYQPRYVRPHFEPEVIPFGICQTAIQFTDILLLQENELTKEKYNADSIHILDTEDGDQMVCYITEDLKYEFWHPEAWPRDRRHLKNRVGFEPNEVWDDTPVAQFTGLEIVDPPPPRDRHAASKAARDRRKKGATRVPKQNTSKPAKRVTFDFGTTEAEASKKLLQYMDDVF